MFHEITRITIVQFEITEIVINLPNFTHSTPIRGSTYSKNVVLRDSQTYSTR